MQNQQPNLKNLSSYNFELPQELIAQTPSKERGQSRLLVYKIKSGEIIHAQFADLLSYLPADSLLVFNNTKVIPARLFVKISDQSEAIIEILLCEQLSETKKAWRCLVKPGKKAKVGTKFQLGNATINVTAINEDGSRNIECDSPLTNEFLEQYGQLPLPPYIQSKYNKDLAERYQTTYAKEGHSIAAPTAGLHFSNELLAETKILFKTTEVTLNVGQGTFSPLRSDNLNEIQLHEEDYNLSPETSELLNQQKQNKKTIIAVGTTTTRVLESQLQNFSKFTAGNYRTSIFLQPGVKFKAIDGLITNFHLPKSSLFILISAFLGLENAQRIYTEAIKEKYRFYSFGDACLFV